MTQGFAAMDPSIGGLCAGHNALTTEVWDGCSQDGMAPGRGYSG